MATIDDFRKDLSSGVEFKKPAVSGTGRLDLKQGIPATMENEGVKSPSLKDSAQNNTSTGVVPASGFFDVPEFVQEINTNLVNYSGDSRKLEMMSSALNKLVNSSDLSQLSEDDLMALVILGFDVQMEDGNIVVYDKNYNEISIDDLKKSNENIQNTLKRLMSAPPSNTLNVDKASGVAMSTAANFTTEAVSTINYAMGGILEAFGVMFKESKTLDKEIERVNKTEKAELDLEREKLAQMLKEAEKTDAKINQSLNNIKELKKTAEGILEKAKSGEPLSETEQKQLKSINSTLKIKQAELIKMQEANESIVKQAEQTFAKFSPELNDSERETLSVMQSAIKAKVNRTGMDVRQNFVANLSEEIYKITSKMNPDELKNVLTDSSARVKMFAPINKTLDKAINSNSISQLTQEDKNILWDKFRVKAVENNGKVEYYYYAEGKENQPVKVTAEQLKQMKADLNNIVSSDTMFSLAIATGEVMNVYSDVKSSENSDSVVDFNISSNEEENDFNPVIPENENDKKSLKDDLLENPYKEERKGSWNEGNFLDDAIEKKREQEKYHQQQIGRIYENRRHITKEQTQKRQDYLESQKVEEEKVLKITKEISNNF